MKIITKRKQSIIQQKAPLRPIESLTDLCMACCTCSAGCPITGVDGFDPRKIVRLVLLGRDRELIESKLPWLCTMCGKCEHACPMGINIVNLIRTARGMVAGTRCPVRSIKQWSLGLKPATILDCPPKTLSLLLKM